jgi:hypothetical protein
MSQYTDFSDNVFACLQQSTLLWHFPATVSPDTVVQFFVERLESLKKTIESLGKEGILEEFASHYPTLPSDLRQENCVSFHQLALKRAESRFRRVVNAADEIDRGGPKGILAPGLAKKLLANIADIPIDAQQIEENWNAVIRAACKGISADLAKISTQLEDECVRTERAAAGRKGTTPAEASHAANVESLVTLQQAAAMVSRSKKTLERCKRNMPMPKVSGGGGKPDEWEWAELRPWLEERFDRKLPERFPADKFRPT